MKRVLFGLMAVITAYINTYAQEKELDFGFEYIYDLDNSPVISQGRTGTCWSFSSTSFFESEIYRINGVWIDLSEIFNARVAYPHKALNYVGRNGKAQFDEGGLCHDVLNAIRQEGLVPDEVYPGVKIDGIHNHAEMVELLKAYLKVIVSNPNGKLSDIWIKGFEGILDAYLGTKPTEFSYQGKKYTPLSFRDKMKINADDYIQLTSFKNFAYNSWVILNIPDNWANGSFYNTSLSDYLEALENALKNGYTVAIDTDVSEPTFNSRKGLAVIPEKDIKTMDNQEKEILYTSSLKELEISEELRQKEFDNYNTTDDHLMHITGMLKDKNGKKWFKVKNSWGVTNQGNDGYVYFSESYFKLKSISIMMHRDALPKNLQKRIK